MSSNEPGSQQRAEDAARAEFHEALVGTGLTSDEATRVVDATVTILRAMERRAIKLAAQSVRGPRR